MHEILEIIAPNGCLATNVELSLLLFDSLISVMVKLGFLLAESEILHLVRSNEKSPG